MTLDPAPSLEAVVITAGSSTPDDASRGPCQGSVFSLIDVGAPAAVRDYYNAVVDQVEIVDLADVVPLLRAEQMEEP